jgi:hypothetical protein
MYYKHVTIVIYNQSDSGIYCQHVITYASNSSLALARVINYTPRVINYAPRVMHQIVASLTIVTYNRSMFIVQGQMLKLLTSVIN